jgi:nucleoid-associated protein YgaU
LHNDIGLVRDCRIWGGLGKKAQFFMHGFYPLSSPGVALPEMKQALKTEAPGPPKEITGNFDASSSSVKKNIQAENQASFLQNPKRIVVKNGDTLHEIAYRFFPENVHEGLKKILKVNPKIDDMNLIYKGQILIIPETDSHRKDPS